jgi:H/ACA ribonucleoprotein complex subunit 4
LGRGNPKVTGVLPIGLENATKIMSYTTNAGKEYICVMQVHCDVDEKTLVEVVKKFEGEIYQRPPVRSSVKRRLRIRRVKAIDLLEVKGRLALLRIESDPGTYMRKICHDAGILLGCGAHMRELRRTRSGIFTEKGLVTLQEVSEALYLWRNCKDESELKRILLPMEFALCGMPKIIVDDMAVNAVAYGAQVMAPGVVAYQKFNKGDLVGVITLKGEGVAIGVAEVSSEELENMEKGEVTRLKRVLIPRDVYPKAWK